MFGEVAVLYGCRRTATVKAEQYNECAYLTNEQFWDMMNSYQVLKKFFKKQIRENYDDELRIFLVSCLREIDYFKQKDSRD